MKNEKFTAVRKVTDNPFFNLYEMDALTNSGKPFGYYFGSRNDENHIKLKTKALNVEGIVIYPVLKEEPDKIVMIRQYRYPLDAYLYELPAGLVDGGETPAEAAIREMKEETGLDFDMRAAARLSGGRFSWEPDLPTNVRRPYSAMHQAASRIGIWKTAKAYKCCWQIRKRRKEY